MNNKKKLYEGVGGMRILLDSFSNNYSEYSLNEEIGEYGVQSTEDHMLTGAYEKIARSISQIKKVRDDLHEVKVYVSNGSKELQRDAELADIAAERMLSFLESLQKGLENFEKNSRKK